MLFKRPPAVWSEADVLRVEDRLGQRLPGAFRTHLLSVGAGELVERIVPGTGGNGILADLYTPHHLGLVATAVEAGTTAGYELIPPRFHVIGGGYGGALCIGLRDDVVGQVFWADFDLANDLGFIGEAPVQGQFCEEMMSLRFLDWGSFRSGVTDWEPV